MPRKSRNMRKHKRPEVLEEAPMQYAPENELGVVFLFSHLAKKWRLRIEQIRPHFPDCIAYQKTKGGEKRLRIEFEFRSRSFKTHGHSAKKCDWIVCWEHNWSEVPKNLYVIELRKEFGLGFNVWIQPVGDPFKKQLSEKNQWLWSVPRNAHQGDLILFYHNYPDKCIKNIFALKGHAEHVRATWKRGMDYMGQIRRICNLKAPIFFEDFQRDRILKTAGFVRARMQGRQNATEYWPYLHEMIVRHNPSVKNKLKKFAPDQLG